MPLLRQLSPLLRRFMPLLRQLLLRPASAMLLIFLAATPLIASAQNATPPAQQTIAQKIAADAHKIDINTATPAQLKSLPGITDQFAARIIAGRPYTEKNQLLRRGVLPHDVYINISDRIIAHRPRAK